MPHFNPPLPPDEQLKLTRRMEVDKAIQVEVARAPYFPSDPEDPEAFRTFQAINAGSDEFMKNYHVRKWPPNDTTLMTSADWVH